jgi:hypothetical protein
MTEDLATKLKTTGAFDTPWLKEQLQNWDATLEQKKAYFMEHMYRCSGRTNGLYTGLWENFCITEAGPIMRERFFEMVEAVRLYEEEMAAQANAEAQDDAEIEKVLMKS